MAGGSGGDKKAECWGSGCVGNVFEPDEEAGVYVEDASSVAPECLMSELWAVQSLVSLES